METLIINIPDKKSTLVKQILRGLGVTIQEKHTHSNYKDKLAKVTTWNEEDLKSFNDAKKSFNSLQ
jgi:cysteine synthase